MRLPALALVAAALAGAGLIASVAIGPASDSGAVRPAEPTISEAAGISSTAGPEDARALRALARAAGEDGARRPIVVDYPRDRSLFPPDMAPPTFLWHDESGSADRFMVDIRFPAGAGGLLILVPAGAPPRGEIDRRAIGEANEVYEPTPYQASARAWRPSAALWAAILARSVDDPARFTFHGYRSADPGSIVSRGSVALAASSDPVGAPIFYRDVPLMPTKTKEGVIKPLSDGAVPLIAWRLKDLGRDDSRVLLENMPTCANCHSFSADGKTFGMDVDGPDGDKGAYGLVPLEPTTVIQGGQVISWNRFPGKPAGHMTLGFLSRVSPDGRHVVSTVNEAIYVQNFTDYRFSQVFYPTRGVLAVYSRDTGRIEALPGADDPAHVHCNPVWTPDGKSIVFSRARAVAPYSAARPRAQFANDPNETPIRYDLYRISFDGGRGGKAVPIAGASDNGRSNTFPKVSPDGKWVVFTRCRNGQLMRPDGKLWIVPLTGGSARELGCNLPVMNSWHSFSPNGRWLVFSSKSNTPYTQMFLTHLDEEGNDSPAILVENATAANRAVNIPEFVNVRYDEFRTISVPAVDHWRHMKAGAALAREGKHPEAAAEFAKALEGEYHDWRSNDWKTHANLSLSLMKLGELDQAVEHVRRSLELNPANPEMRTNLAFLLAERGEGAEALRHLDAAVALSPNDPKVRCNRAKLRMTLGDTDGGIADFDEAIRLDGKSAEAYAGRGAARTNRGDARGARQDLDRALALDPASPNAWYFRARLRLDAGDSTGAEADLARAAALVPPGSVQSRAIEALRVEIRERTAR